MREVSREIPEMLIQHLVRALAPSAMLQLADMLEMDREGMETSSRWGKAVAPHVHRQLGGRPLCHQGDLSRDVSEVLQRILDQVSTALLAPRYLLVTQLDDKQPRQVHSVGFREHRAEVYADRIMVGELSEAADGVLDVEIGSGDKVLGHLVAFFTSNGTVNERDRRVLKAYARHATAALEVITSLDGARRDRDLAFRDGDVAAAVPIVSKGRLLGFITAGCSSRPSEVERADILERLAGLADHAATALEAPSCSNGCSTSPCTIA